MWFPFTKTDGKCVECVLCTTCRHFSFCLELRVTTIHQQHGNHWSWNRALHHSGQNKRIHFVLSARLWIYFTFLQIIRAFQPSAPQTAPGCGSRTCFSLILCCKGHHNISPSKLQGIAFVEIKIKIKSWNQNVESQLINHAFRHGRW